MLVNSCAELASVTSNVVGVYRGSAAQLILHCEFASRYEPLCRHALSPVRHSLCRVQDVPGDAQDPRRRALPVVGRCQPHDARGPLAAHVHMSQPATQEVPDGQAGRLGGRLVRQGVCCYVHSESVY